MNATPLTNLPCVSFALAKRLADAGLELLTALCWVTGEETFGTPLGGWDVITRQDWVPYSDPDECPDAKMLPAPTTDELLGLLQEWGLFASVGRHGDKWAVHYWPSELMRSAPWGPPRDTGRTNFHPATSYALAEAAGGAVLFILEGRQLDRAASASESLNHPAGEAQP